MASLDTFQGFPEVPLPFCHPCTSPPSHPIQSLTPRFFIALVNIAVQPFSPLPLSLEYPPRFAAASLFLIFFRSLILSPVQSLSKTTLINLISAKWHP